jgi:hypothetical protein
MNNRVRVEKIKLLKNKQASDHVFIHFSLFSINVGVIFEIPALTFTQEQNCESK